MSVFSTEAKNVMLDALDPDEIQLHDGDPGSDGTANRVGGADGEEPATFDPAADGERPLAEDVDFDGLDDGQTVTWISVWNSTDSRFLGKASLDGDNEANAAGEITVTTDTRLIIEDPA